MNSLSSIYKILDQHQQQQAMQQSGGRAAQAYVASDKNPGGISTAYQAYLKSLSNVPTLAGDVRKALPRVSRELSDGSSV